MRRTFLVAATAGFAVGFNVGLLVVYLLVAAAVGLFPRLLALLG